MKYDFAAIEPKWQKKWQETGVYQTGNHSDKPKFYALVEFPYPSGQGLHVGHARPYTAMDVVARKRRMDGYNVLRTLLPYDKAAAYERLVGPYVNLILIVLCFTGVVSVVITPLSTLYLRLCRAILSLVLF